MPLKLWLKRRDIYDNPAARIGAFPKANRKHIARNLKVFNRAREGNIFHIISDFLSDDSRVRFAHLAKDLSEIYPCEIKIHICDDVMFNGLPRLNGNYLAYFRFFIPRFMPQNCAMCLYLDIDMLVVGDLRLQRRAKNRQKNRLSRHHQSSRRRRRTRHADSRERRIAKKLAPCCR